MKLDNLNNSSARNMGDEWDITSLNSYIARIKELAKIEEYTDHPLLCKKCKSNSWNMLKRTTINRIKANCTICGNKQVLIKRNLIDTFREVKI